MITPTVSSANQLVPRIIVDQENNDWSNALISQNEQHVLLAWLQIYRRDILLSDFQMSTVANQHKHSINYLAQSHQLSLSVKTKFLEQVKLHQKRVGLSHPRGRCFTPLEWNPDEDEAGCSGGDLVAEFSVSARCFLFEPACFSPVYTDEASI